MSKYDPYDDEDMDRLLDEVEQLTGKGRRPEPDIDDYTPQEARGHQDTMLYRNSGNGYGQKIRNFANGYGAQEGPAAREPERSAGRSPIYNADFEQRPKKPQPARKPQPRYEEPAHYRPEETGKKKKKRKKGGCCLPTLVITLLILVLIPVMVWNWVFDQPVSRDSLGPRKDDTSVILICGTDIGGDRTDTVMLLYLSGSESRMGLLSLPRDTYTLTAAGNPAKLNAAYARNGYGESGMEGLMDYVQETVGYRPDGYILVDMEMVEQVADAMGGVDVEVPMDMEVDGLALEAGYQHLNGEQILALLRFRAGYWNADLGRVAMQQKVLSACMQQWMSADKVAGALPLVMEVLDTATTDLSLRNALWLGKTALSCKGDISGNTLPGNPDYYDAYGVNYVLLYPDQVAAMVNESYNPYQVEITEDLLKIAG